MHGPPRGTCFAGFGAAASGGRSSLQHLTPREPSQAMSATNPFTARDSASWVTCSEALSMQWFQGNHCRNESGAADGENLEVKRQEKKGETAQRGGMNLEVKGTRHQGGGWHSNFISPLKYQAARACFSVVFSALLFWQQPMCPAPRRPCEGTSPLK